MLISELIFVGRGIFESFHILLEIFKSMVSFYRINKALLGISIVGLSFYMMEMRKKMVVTSLLELLCVRKSSLLLVILVVERSNIFSITLLDYQR